MGNQGNCQASITDITALPTAWLLRAFQFFFPIEHDNLPDLDGQYPQPFANVLEESSYNNFPDDASIFSANFTSWDFPSVSTDAIPATLTCGEHGKGLSLVMCPMFEWYCPCHSGREDKCSCARSNRGTCESAPFEILSPY